MKSHSYYTGEKTEEKFSKYCKKNKIWRQKIRVPLELDENGVNQALAQPCDFIVITPRETKWIEVKEIWSKSSFLKERFHQQYKLTKLSEICQFSKGYVLLNFVGKEKLFYIPILDFNRIAKATRNKKSINIKDIPSRFETTWKTLEI